MTKNIRLRTAVNEHICPLQDALENIMQQAGFG